MLTHGNVNFFDLCFGKIASFYFHVYKLLILLIFIWKVVFFCISTRTMICLQQTKNQIQWFKSFWNAYLYLCNWHSLRWQILRLQSKQWILIRMSQPIFLCLNLFYFFWKISDIWLLHTLQARNDWKVWCFYCDFRNCMLFPLPFLYPQRGVSSLVFAN